MFNLTGSIVALVTPMKEDGSICWQSLSELINWHINSGTSAIVVVGTTGESATLDVSEHVQVIEQCVQYSSDKIPIIAGTGANSTREAIYLTSAAKEAGAKAALLVTPYYNRPTQEGLVKHYEAISSFLHLFYFCFRKQNRHLHPPRYPFTYHLVESWANYTERFLANSPFFSCGLLHGLADFMV